MFSQVKIWQVPENGLRTNLSEWQVDLHGHGRRVGYIEWHPTADNIILSAGLDCKVGIFEPSRKKTGLFGFRPGPTQTGLYSL